MTDALRVFLADDHHLLVEGFRYALADFHIDVVAAVFSLDGIVDHYVDTQPDVAVIDVRFRNSPMETGLDACEKILARDPSAKLIVFSQFDDHYIIERAYTIGALAFTLKDESIEVLVQAIRTVSQGREYYSPRVAQLLARSSVKTRSPTKLLDEKELRAFLLTADGRTMAEISTEMNLSTKTVGLLLRNIKLKLAIETQADFTKLAIQFGLTTAEVRTKL